MSQQQQQVNSAGESTNQDIDYLTINRARWDERAPHVSHSTSLAHTSATTMTTTILRLSAAAL